MPLLCYDCKCNYDEEMPCSLNLSREEWLLIKPEDGLLCANCIIKRAAELPGVICLYARIMYAEDYP